jgi:hypothetical protein
MMVPMAGGEFIGLTDDYGYEQPEDPNQLAMSQSDIYLMFGTNPNAL